MLSSLVFSVSTANIMLFPRNKKIPPNRDIYFIFNTRYSAECIYQAIWSLLRDDDVEALAVAEVVDGGDGVVARGG